MTTTCLPTFLPPTPTNELADVSYLHQDVATEHVRTQRIPRPTRATTLQWIPTLGTR